MKQIRIPSVQLLEFHRKYFSKPWFSLAALSNGNRKKFICAYPFFEVFLCWPHLTRESKLRNEYWRPYSAFILSEQLSDYAFYIKRQLVCPRLEASQGVIHLYLTLAWRVTDRQGLRVTDRQGFSSVLCGRRRGWQLTDQISDPEAGL